MEPMRSSLGLPSIVPALPLALLLAGCGGSSGTAPSPASSGRLDLTTETAHFLIRYAALDASCIEAVARHLEASQGRICADLRYALDFTVVLEIYPDLDSLHRAMGSPDAPEWVVGLSNLAGEIKVLSPLHPGSDRTFESMLKCMDHELTHAVVLRGLGAIRLPAWLSEGTASWEARLIDEAGWAGIQPYVETGRIPTFAGLSTEASFADNGGYVWSYTIVDFAMAEYGLGTLRPWIDNRGGFEATFGVGEEAFRAGWIAYLKARYPASGEAS
jgi:hypothetical protein